MINVVGCGYIGLPTALSFASSGVEVVATDIDNKKIEQLNRDVITFVEKNLSELFLSAKNNISFTTDYVTADEYIIAVPTPIAEDKSIDLRACINALENVSRVCREDSYIIIESTVAPGSIDAMVKTVFRDKPVRIAYAPERIIPGNMIYEIQNNARIIGANDKNTAIHVENLYRNFVRGDICLTDIKTAEIVKLAENAYRAVNIAYANELAMICRREGAGVNEVISLCNMHPRVSILNPGPGVGGHCIPVDPWFLSAGNDIDKKTDVIKAACMMNAEMPHYILERIKDIMSENEVIDPSEVGLYGITFKENVDDIRNSPTLDILKEETGFLSYDPYLQNRLSDNQYFSSEEFFKAVKMVVVLVAHDEIRKNQSFLEDKIVFDVKNICECGRKIYKL